MESGESGDEAKRKRGHEKKTIFEKSKKIARSPTGKKVEEMNMETIIEMMQEIRDEMRQIKEQNKKNGDELVKIRKENEEQKKEIEILKKDKNEMEKKIKDIEETLELKEKIEKKNNVIIRGVEIKEEDGIKQYVTNLLKEELGLEAKIKNAVILGKDKNRGILVELDGWEEKMKVMRNKRKLKGGNIYIDADLTKKEREIQKKIKEIGRAEKEQGKRIRVGYKKIQIDGQWHKWVEEKNNLENFC